MPHERGETESRPSKRGKREVKKKKKETGVIKEVHGSLFSLTEQLQRAAVLF